MLTKVTACRSVIGPLFASDTAASRVMTPPKNAHTATFHTISRNRYTRVWALTPGDTIFATGTSSFTSGSTSTGTDPEMNRPMASARSVADPLSTLVAKMNGFGPRYSSHGMARNRPGGTGTFVSGSVWP